MIKGVSFRVSQTFDSNILYQIFDCINFSDFCWYNIESQNESWRNTNGDEYFTKSFYCGDEFVRLLSSNAYIIFLKLQAYFEIHEFYEIHTYQEFLISDCQLLFLINDCEFVEIYIKDEKIANSIFIKANKNQYLDVKYITEDNDDRIVLDVI